MVTAQQARELSKASDDPKLEQALLKRRNSGGWKVKQSNRE